MLRPFTHFACFGFLSALLTRPSLAAPTTNGDPCVQVAGKAFVDSADALACLKSFPFNDTLRQNILSVVSRVFDFYTFEIFYPNSPAPFQESTTDIRGQLQRISQAHYETDYDFNLDLFDFINQMNDGHTLWIPYCYLTYNNILPAPIVFLDEGVFIAPDSVELLQTVGPGFTSFLAEKGFDWERLAGAKVIEIGGLPVVDYIYHIAKTVSGTYLDRNVRMNSVVSSYRIVGSKWSQRLGDHASELFLRQTSLDMLLIPKGSSSGTPEMVNVPFVAEFLGSNFADGASYWANNCAATKLTNGVDRSQASEVEISDHPLRLTRAALARPVIRPNSAIGLPGPFVPTLESTGGSAGPTKSYILPGKRTGVMFVGSFEGDFFQAQVDIATAFDEFAASGVTNLVIDVTNNGGGYVCLGLFLHQYLSGKGSGIPGFESSSRANPLAQKIVEANIERHNPSKLSYYSSNNWLFLNGTRMPKDYNYNNPTTNYDINEQNQLTSQHFADLCPSPPNGVTIPSTPPFDLNNVVIIGNGNCASTCALFTTLMFEHHGTKIATFGLDPNESMQFKGMAGNQVLEWSDLDSEIKTAGLKNDPLAPPDLLVNGNMRHNWRTAYSYANLNLPIAYVDERPQFRFAYTKETYNNPQNVWTFVDKKFFGDTH